ncbi:YkgJ family cysteine cluster protein [Planctomycetes bacterium TBK1r]|uniref:YkgJ family cysteine cluster protein n=1 Tax=Stieleria magnilauensis TaxID=2527963 RepID=UPI0011A21C21
MSELPVVDCEGCGVCCLHMGYPAFNLTLDQLADVETIDVASLSPVAQADLARWVAMPSRLRDGILQQMADYVAPIGATLDGPCTWLDLETKQCRHHQHRPQVCRDFAVGSVGCLQWRAAYVDVP